jgi:phosphoribosylformylglycinamidine synthase subunit PurS
MLFDARVDVTHKPGIADPQGATVQRALPALGWTNVSDVRIAKSIRLVIDADDELRACEQIDDMCRRLLTNPVLESFTVTIAEHVA